MPRRRLEGEAIRDAMLAVSGRLNEKRGGPSVLPELPSNCAWGDADARTLYITARTGLYKIHVNVAGVR